MTVVASGWRANCDSVRINDLLTRSLLILWYARPADVSCFRDSEEGLCGQYHSGEGLGGRNWRVERRVTDGLVEGFTGQTLLIVQEE